MGVRLPSEYQEVEWIQRDSNSSAVAYILTDYVPVNGDSIDMTVMVTANRTQCLFSAGANDYQFIAIFDVPGAGPTLWCKYFQTGGAPKMMPTNYLNTWQHLTVSGTGLFQFAGASVQCGYQAPLNGDYTELMIFSRRRATSDVGFLGKVKEVVVANNDQNKLHFIPCYRKSDSKPGMYDLVTKQFFTNSGTGEFLVGPDVIDSISPWMVARRRMLMRQYIGYEENKGFTGAYRNVSTGTLVGRFLTGYIPIKGAKRLSCYYGGNITSGAKHFIVEYNGDKIYTDKDGYWDMTVKNQRTVPLETSDAQYVRFSGFMDVIDQCYVKNADTGETLWKKGM